MKQNLQIIEIGMQRSDTHFVVVDFDEVFVVVVVVDFDGHQRISITQLKPHFVDDYGVERGL